MVRMSCLFNIRCFIFTIINSLTPVHESDVTFHLFTKSNPTNSTFLSRLSEAPIESGAKLLLVIHGWDYNHEDWWNKDLNNIYLAKTGNYNVIQVDWSIRSRLFYHVAAPDCKIIGRIIGKQIVQLFATRSVDLSQLHLIGFSLGAHVAGFAGKEVFDRTGLTLPRITALDPARPLFERVFATDDDRLSRNDAQVVFVIHSSGGKFGFLAPLGTTDVFANGGTSVQPGCPNLSDRRVPPWYCHHVRSVEYFLEAVKTGSIVATKCHSFKAYTSKSCRGNRKINVGGEISTKDAGQYYFRTSWKSPYGLGNE